MEDEVPGRNSDAPRPMLNLNGQKRTRSGEFSLGKAISQMIYDHQFKAITGTDSKDDYV